MPRSFQILHSVSFSLSILCFRASIMALSLDSRSIFATLLVRSFSIFLRPICGTPGYASVQSDPASLRSRSCLGWYSNYHASLDHDREGSTQFSLILQGNCFFEAAEESLGRQGKGARFGTIIFCTDRARPSAKGHGCFLSTGDARSALARKSAGNLDNVMARALLSLVKCIPGR